MGALFFPMTGHGSLSVSALPSIGLGRLLPKWLLSLNQLTCNQDSLGCGTDVVLQH